jgi:hypothetical protein
MPTVRQVTLSLLVAAGTIAARVEAQDVHALDLFNVRVKTGQLITQSFSDLKTDFHVRLKSDTRLTPSFAELVMPDGRHFIPSSITPGHGQLDYQWDLDFTRGTEFSYQIEVIERLKNELNVTTFFTPVESPTDVPTLGFNVTQNGDVYLLNGYPSPIQFENLLFQFPASFEPDLFFALLSGPATGVPGLLTSGIVPGSGPSGLPGQLFVGHFPLSEGDMLTGRTDTRFVDPAFSVLTSRVALAHEHPSTVPEPSTLALAALSLGALLGGRLSRRWSR